MKSSAANIGIIATLVVNIALIVGFAVSIATKLDNIAYTSSSNCSLLKSAIILSIEQSAAIQHPRQRSPDISKIEDNFSSIQCR